VIDFLDGQLSEAEQGELYLFLEANPDIKEEFDSLREENPTVFAIDSISFPLKERLIKKPVGQEYVDEFTWLCIARLEGDASPAELDQLSNLLRENPSLSAELALFEKTKLRPTEGVTFTGKGQLARHRVGSTFTIHRYAVAASIAALMVLVSIPMGNRIENRKQFTADHSNMVANSRRSSVSDFVSSTKTAVALVEKPKAQRIKIREVYPDSASLEVLKIEQTGSRAESDQLLAALNPIEASVQIVVDNPLEQLNVASNDERLINMNPAENPSRYLSVGEFLAEKVVEKTGVNPKFIKSSPKAKFWQVAQVGIQGVSRVLGIPVKIDKEYDKEGNLKKMTIDSKLLAISRSF